jgi:uncharacterized repeat protein (TIGR01451 family)
MKKINVLILLALGFLSLNTTILYGLPSVSLSVESISPGGASPNVTAGDIITYSTTVGLPEGTINSLALTYTLPAGFDYSSFSIDNTGFNGSGNGATSVNNSGNVETGKTITIDFTTDITVNIDGNNVNNYFIVTIDLVVKGSVAANNASSSLQTKMTSISMSYTGLGSPVTDQSSVNFSEPILAVSQVITGTPAERGDNLAFSITIENTGTAPAYGIEIENILNGIALDLTSITQGSIPTGYTFNYSNPKVTLSANASVSLSAGNSINFTFTGNVKSDAPFNTYSNSVDVSGSSQDGTVTDERTNTNDNSTNYQVINPLPVELFAFKGFQSQNGIQLTWQTATEINNSHFEVEWSTDGKTFEKIAQVQGAGTTNNMQFYTSLHSTPASGLNYYRLKQVDFDGKFEYSHIVNVERTTNSSHDLQGSDIEYQIFPNPATDYIEIHGINEGELVQIFNINGQLLKEFQNQSNHKILPITDLLKGTYMIKIGNTTPHIFIKN